MLNGQRFNFTEKVDDSGRSVVMPYLPLRLTNGSQSIEVMALLDTGASVNVLPYDMGLQLGAVWEEQTVAIPYFRVGYCPLSFEGNFAVAKTLLFPGYSKTPEYECILNLNLPENERKSLFKKITKQDAKSLLETGDFASIKWLHENTIPQVVQMNNKVYDHEKSITSAIRELQK